MPERAKVVSIDGLAIRVPRLSTRKLLHVERYLARQARAAHNLGFPGLERSYTCAWLAFRLWRMVQLAADGESISVEQIPSVAHSQATDSTNAEISKNVVEKTSVF